MKNNVLAGLGVLLLIGLGIGAWLLFQRAGDKEGISQGTTTPTPKATASPSPSFNWKLYSNEEIGFSMRYPSGMEVSQEGGMALFFQGGPTQQGENTDLYDGISLTVERKKLAANQTVEAMIRSEAGKLVSGSEIFQIIQEPHRALFAGYEGYAYTAAGLGTVTYIAISPEQGEAIEVSYMSEDPTKQGFDAIVREMLDSFIVLTVGGK